MICRLELIEGPRADGQSRFACTICKRETGWLDSTRTPETIERNCKSRGIGDTIARVTHALGIKTCGGCSERQEKLNELIPYAD